MLGALFLATTLFFWCLVQLIKMLRSGDGHRTMDAFFWIMFLILPTALGGIVWMIMSLSYLAEAYF